MGIALPAIPRRNPPDCPAGPQVVVGVGIACGICEDQLSVSWRVSRWQEGHASLELDDPVTKLTNWSWSRGGGGGKAKLKCVQK